MPGIVLSVIFSVLAFGMVLMMNKVIDRRKVSEAKTGEEFLGSDEGHCDEKQKWQVDEI